MASNLSRAVPASVTRHVAARSRTVAPVKCAPAAINLSLKHCQPCEEARGSLEYLGLSLALDKETAMQYLRQVDGWQLYQDDHCNYRIRKVWRVKSFMKGLELCQRIAMVAEVEGHHPDLHLESWNMLTVELWTHARLGLTENDFIVASKIDKLPKDDLLSKKKYRRP